MVAIPLRAGDELGSETRVEVTTSPVLDVLAPAGLPGSTQVLAWRRAAQRSSRREGGQRAVDRARARGEDPPSVVFGSLITSQTSWDVVAGARERPGIGRRQVTVQTSIRASPLSTVLLATDG